jgi:ATP-binding cassette, subfamily C (CFTR/MRP), member 1
MQSDFASSALAPVWGFGIYFFTAIDTSSFTESFAFTALTLFRLLNQPLVHAIYGLEQVQTVLTSFSRIQNYLLSPEWQSPDADPKSSFAEFALFDEPGYSSRRESDEITLYEGMNSDMKTPNVAIQIDHVSAKYESEERATLTDLSLIVPSGELTMIYGPIGCGKSTIVKLILGEMASASGSIARSFSKAAYCPQSPWLMWGSIRSNIVGMSGWDKLWYETVVQACALVEDFKMFEHGDETNCGSCGSRLSGGQQIRVVSLPFEVVYRPIVNSGSHLLELCTRATR